MKYIQNKVNLMLWLLLPCLSFAANWAGGSSMPDDTRLVDGKSYYVISTANELAWFAAQVNGGNTNINAVLDNDIVLFQDTITGPASGATRWNAIGKTKALAFEGVFDGNGKTVRGVYVNDTSAIVGDTIIRGFFGVLGNSGVVKNLTLTNAYVYVHHLKMTSSRIAGAMAGGIAGSNMGIVSGVRVDGYVRALATGFYSTTFYKAYCVAGGVVGYNTGNMEKDTSEVRVTLSADTTSSYAGGIAGYNGGRIAECINLDSISDYSVWSSSFVGGIVGSSSGSITNCTNSGSVSSSPPNCVGGIAGYSSGSITNCTNSGSFSGSYYVGGIAGYMDSGSIMNCTNSGSVSGSSSAGGIAGYMGSGSITNCTNSGSVVSGSSYAGGIAGSSSGSITNCTNSGSVSGSYYAGGIAGYSSGSITNCTNSGSVSGSSSYSYSYAGGIVGYMGSTAAIIRYSYSIVDKLSATITSSYSTYDKAYAGGLVGYNAGGYIENAYAVTSVLRASRAYSSSNAYMGGLIGLNKSASRFRMAYFDSDVSGFSSAIGLDSASALTTYVGGLSTADMQTAKFAWQLNTTNGDSANVGVWSHGNGYPVFADAAHLATHRVIFDNASFTSTRYTDSTGIIISFPAAPTSVSGAFIGWVYDTTKVLMSGTKVTEDMIVSALFSSMERAIVTFQDSDGTEMVSRLVNDDGTVILPADPTPGVGEFFFGWFDSNGTRLSASTVVTANVTVNAVYQSISDTKYAISFVSDGNLLQSDSLTRGTSPSYTGTILAKKNTVQYTYTFSKWIPDLVPATDSATYTAVFDSTINRYFVVFRHATGDTLQKDSLDYGDTPVYSGSTPGLLTTAAASYTFAGWIPTITTVTRNATYTAVFDTTATTFTVQFLVNGSVVKSETVAYGNAPTAPENPAKPATVQYVYKFTGWDKNFSSVTTDLTVTALFSASTRKYLVQFYAEENLAQSDSVAYGSSPSYTGTTPSKTSTVQYSYTFQGWSPTIASVTENALYTAVFDSTVNTYKVTFASESETLQSSQIAYGVLPVYNGETPTKAATSQYAYNFGGWDPDITRVTGSATYTAMFDATLVQSSSSFAQSSSSSVKSSSSSAKSSSSSVIMNSSSSIAVNSSSSAKFSSSSTVASSSSNTVIVPEYSRIPQFTLTMTGRILRVENATVNAVFAVMDVQGHIFSHGMVMQSTFSMEVPGPGIYLIRIGQNVRSVRVRE